MIYLIDLYRYNNKLSLRYILSRINISTHETHQRTHIYY